MDWRWSQPISFIDAELIQNLKPEGGGPSGNTCPRWQSQTLHITSTRVMPNEVSFSYLITLSFTDSVKLGQPVPDSNFCPESKRGVPQQRQAYRPGSCASQYSPVKGRSVPFFLVMWNSSGVNSFFHSSSDLSTLRSGAGLFFAYFKTSFQFKILKSLARVVDEIYTLNITMLIKFMLLVLYLVSSSALQVL